MAALVAVVNVGARPARVGRSFRRVGCRRGRCAALFPEGMILPSACSVSADRRTQLTGGIRIGSVHGAGPAVPRKRGREDRRQGGRRSDRGVSADHVRHRRHAAVSPRATWLTMFVALEVFSLPLYLMCGLACRRRLLSQESALKYFCWAPSAFFLYGAALFLRSHHHAAPHRYRRRHRSHGANTRLASSAPALIAVGLLFKVGAVPFHLVGSRRVPGRPHDHGLHGGGQ